MDNLTAIQIIEEGADSEEELISAYQALYDSGVWVALQGSYQRAINSLIEAGEIIT